MAHADQVIEGTCSYDQGDVHAEWTIYPSCVPTVGDLRENLELPVACRLHVAPTPVTAVSGGDARLTGGAWAFSTTIKDGMTCPDGSTAPNQQTDTFDDVTMTGTRSVSNSNVCDGQLAAKLVNLPFSSPSPGRCPSRSTGIRPTGDPGGLKRCH